MKALVPRGNLSAKKVLDSERFYLTEIRMPLYCPHRVKAAQRDKMLPPIKGDTMNQINVTAKTKTGLTYDVQINLEHQMKVTISITLSTLFSVLSLRAYLRSSRVLA